jgi:O-antigen/teichoic acid export membrane protein
MTPPAAAPDEVAHSPELPRNLTTRSEGGRVRAAARTVARAAWSSPPRRASTLTAVQYGLSQVLRLVSNLVLARLLFPEAFGLMAMVQVFMAALAMFSDIGLGPSIIQHKRGDERAFFNSAWTLQVIRGFVLWGLAVAVAWPAAVFFGMPELVLLLPLVGATAAISGFDSTAFWSARRHMRLGRVFAMELGSQSLSIVIMLSLAMVYYANPAAAAALASRAINALPGWVGAGMDPAKLAGVMCLAVGGLAGPAVRAVLTHSVLDRNHGNLFGWERAAVREIFHFGKWIFVSTFLTFFAARLDVLLVGRMLSDRDLGIYGFGQTMALMLPNAVLSLGGAVLFPLFSRVARENPSMLRAQVGRVRRTLLLPTMAGLAVLILLGNWIVWILYDDRYQNAGWVLQVLAAGAPALLISATYGNAMLALGRSREIVIILIPQICFLLAGSLAGHAIAPHLWGNGALAVFAGPAPDWAPLAGLVVGFALTEWLNYPIVLWRAFKNGVANPGLDLLILAIVAGTSALAILLR